ncbi:hypothetical protein NIES2100_35010 [Calothrix sp. NIES-2100]|uniref:phage baseplate assembly protein V n=1 Tax=Calothrix sp. NIES-2100 TaxID=1954172 RepID=UPI000B60F908|nr:hypothetical protein NIES2100_35010 [Calothrix sp. NIES-2100]
MEKLFELWLTAEKASQIALDQQGRHQYPVLAVVTNNSDPENKRRIKVSLPSSPNLESDWLRRILPYPQIDPPLPAVGQTVLILYIDGVETNGFYLSVVNATNPPRSKDSAQNDYSESIPGNRSTEINGNDDLTVNKTVTTSAAEDITIKAGKSIKFQTDSGAYLELSEAGFVTLADAYGHKWTLGGSGGNAWVWDANGASIQVVNATNFSINNHQIATVGATDTHGDTITNRGW